MFCLYRNQVCNACTISHCASSTYSSWDIFSILPSLFSPVSPTTRMRSILTFSLSPSLSTTNMTRLETFWNLTNRSSTLAVPVVVSQSFSSSVISCVAGRSVALSKLRICGLFVKILRTLGLDGFSSSSVSVGWEVICREWTFSVHWKGRYIKSWSSVSLST